MPEKHVSEEACKQHRKRIWRTSSFILTLGALFVVVATWSVRVGYTAIMKSVEIEKKVSETQKEIEKKISDTQKTVEVHAAAEIPRYNEIQNSLERIESEQVRMHSRLDAILGSSGK